MLLVKAKIHNLSHLDYPRGDVSNAMVTSLPIRKGMKASSDMLAKGHGIKQGWGNQG
jgi:hypothetical protein